MDTSFTTTLLAAAALAAVLPAAVRRLALSRAKHPSLTGHSRMAKRVAALLPGYAYSEDKFFNSDGAPATEVAKRRAGLQRLATNFRARCPESLALTAQLREGISDLKFTGAYRVPYQYSPFLRQHLQVGAVLQRSDGVLLTDLDGNRYYDLAGSYGVNVFGYDVYKRCIAEGARQVEELGPVLGNYHPCVLRNVQR